ncbi:site-2 protease family protein [Streptomyces sp. TRM49041]|uniref:site-2 protease family protein n=1 Tax=Streptomyces sp. TRM49041 TaxID=2603216 RepID=UPI0011ECC599|nr:site-2 protease family protein [Streptomyces sp. TRM49041]
MRASLTIGRIAQVRVGVHWSVLFIFALIVWGLAQGRFPAAHPGYATALYWTAGLVTAVVFFLSLLAHELAHAVVARRHGIQVDDIVLWLLGGAARLQSEAASPGAELRIAGVGPLVSLLLGGVFSLAAWLLSVVSAPELLTEAVVWLAAINILLAVFNAVPAAPLDGGRLLRALLWWRTGDRLRATAGATTAGRVFGWLLVLLGLLLFLRTGAFGGLWLALIGWFLVAAATAEGRQAQLRGVLAGVPVRQAMTPDPVTAPDTMTVADFLADPHYRYRHSAFPALDAYGHPAGLMTLDRARAVPEDRRRAVRVGEVMVPLSEVTVVAPDDPLADLLPRMEPGADHRVLVVESGRLVGLVTSSDVSRTVTWMMSFRPGGQEPPRWGDRT